MAKKIKRENEDWIELSGNEFIEAMKGKTVTMEDRSEHSFLKDEHEDGFGGLMKNVIVLNLVLVTEEVCIQASKPTQLIFPYLIWLEKGEFQKDFSIYGGIFHQNFSILEGTFLQDFWVNAGEFQQGFSIYEGIFQKDFSIHGGNFQKGFSVHGGEFQQGFWIHAGEFQQDFSIYGGQYIKDFTIDGGKFQQGFIIMGGEFQQGFYVDGGEFQQEFWIMKGNFQQDFGINGGTFQQEFWVSGGKFQQKFSINEGIFKKIRLSLKRENFIHHLYFLASEMISLEINDANINSLTFDCIVKSDSAIYLQNFQLNRIAFTENFKNEGTFSISQVKATNAIHRTEEDIGKPLVKKPSHLILQKSDMGNTVFLDTLFDSFDKIVLHRSKLNNISTSHGHFPLKTKHSEKVYSGIIEKENEETKYQANNTELAETYNHLQLAMEKQGNRTWAFKYYAEYMEWYRLEQKEKKNWAQYITLSLNKLSTNYGASWIRSFLMILGVAFVFFIGYVLALPDIRLIPSFPACLYVGNNIDFFSRYYFDFIIPTHKIDFIDGYKAGFLSAFLDVFGRIIIGYLIYQTIAAFRQFGKR